MNRPPLDYLIDYLRFPSISTQSNHKPDMEACATWLVDLFREMGLEAKIHKTKGHPIVLAKSAKKAGKPTLLIYGHYDVQPPEPLAEWTTPPFEPTLRDGKLYARGAGDNKGPTLAHILGTKKILEEGELPVNIIYLIEGEEEIGSPNLEGFIRDHREELACDIIAISDTIMPANDWPTLTYGLRGVAAMELTVRGPERDLHSGIFGGAVANPATAAGRLIASLHDEKGHVQIEGFYEDIRPLEKWEHEAFANRPSTDTDFLELTGSPILWGEDGFSTFERVGARPTAEINGISGGYQGEGTKTVLPREAIVKITFRLVPDQTPEKILRLAEAHFRKHCPPGVTLEIEHGHGGMAYFSDPTTRYGVAAKRALKTAFGKEPALIREGGSIPILHQFHDILKTDILLMALAAPDVQAHSPNESFPVKNLESGIRLHQEFLKELAAC
ncbi:MAG: dipeptidase [Chthoniobacterales bacterium]